MADASRIFHGTLVATVVQTVTFDRNFDAVEILNRNGAAEIFVKAGTVAQPPSDPAVDQADTEILPATIGSVEIPTPQAGDTVIKLISAGIPTFSVRGLIGPSEPTD